MSSSRRALVVALGVMLLAGGCAKTEVTTVRKYTGPLPKPDRVIIHDFAVSPSDVSLDKGAVAKLARESGSQSQTQEEIKAGRAVANALSRQLVVDLRKMGIVAERAASAGPPTKRTLIITGQFLSVDQGNQTARVWLGFGLGGTALRTQLQAVQGFGPNRTFVAQGRTVAKSSLKPGMVVSLASGAGAAVAVGATTTGASEAFLATVEADAKRTAKEVAKKIGNAYVKRGWLPREALR